MPLALLFFLKIALVIGVFGGSIQLLKVFHFCEKTPLKNSFFFIFGCAGSLVLHGLFSSCYKRATLQLWCAGFSSQWLPLLWSTGPRTHGLSSGSSQAPEHRLHACGAQAQSLHSTWTLPRWGIESVSPALEGGLFTSEPPKKPCHWNSERDCIESVDCFE